MIITTCIIEIVIIIIITVKLIIIAISKIACLVKHLSLQVNYLYYYSCVYENKFE